MRRYSLEEIVASLQEATGLNTLEESEVLSQRLPSVSPDPVPYVVSDHGIGFYFRLCFREPGYLGSKLRIFLRSREFRKRCYGLLRHAVARSSRRIVRWFYGIPVLGYVFETVIDICRLPVLLRNMKIQQQSDVIMLQEQLSRGVVSRQDLQDIERMMHNLEALVNTKVDRADVQRHHENLRKKMDEDAPARLSVRPGSRRKRTD